MVGVSSSSAKTYVWGAEVAFVTMLATKRGDVALLDVARATKGCRASRARACVWSMTWMRSTQVRGGEMNEVSG